ncbi:MAG: tRNA(Ile)(2)-agmatinylcytidine synthase, partial [Methanospirillum sp.]|uniref:tRNA(Ile)(2)-agmatinylcytidine synthase n=1 Tax=Methanospirillum sp. TaxID=45200 RepID=UPI0023699A65
MQTFWIGLDDTDSPEGMCTTWLGARLIRDLRNFGFRIDEARLIRLNPTIPYRTRGNAAIAIRVTGDPSIAFDHACNLVTTYADLTCEKTHPGVVVADHQFPSEFYTKAVTAVCTIAEAEELLKEHAIAWKGFKLGRGLIGATAAIASDLSDHTWELLAYRDETRWTTPREVDAVSLFTAEEATTPHTWDTVDPDRGSVVCVPHTPDPVLYGIRGDSPFAIAHAVSCIRSEPYPWGQIWLTNQGTDAHILCGKIGSLTEGSSYRVRGTVLKPPATGIGGHVSFCIGDNGRELPCMAFEPTKCFRDHVRSLIPGDQIIAVGSFLNSTLNLEKICLSIRKTDEHKNAPYCKICQKQMTSAGAGKGYKCRKCGERTQTP